MDWRVARVDNEPAFKPGWYVWSVNPDGELWYPHDGPHASEQEAIAAMETMPVTTDEISCPTCDKKSNPVLIVCRKLARLKGAPSPIIRETWIGKVLELADEARAALALARK